MTDNTANISDEEKDRVHRKELLKKKDSGKTRKDKGYKMFEEEDSEEEPIITDDVRSPSKMKKHSKPSFKFAKKEKYFKKEKEEKKEKESKKEEKKKEEKVAKEKSRIAKDKKKARLDADERDLSVHQVFGVPLAVAVEKSKCHDDVPLPAIFRECIDFIEEFGLSCEGIYRISGVKSKVQALKDCYNRSEPVYLQEHEPNVVASLLKLYLRDLPEPVLTKLLMPKFEETSTLKNVKQKVETFQKLIEDLPACNRFLLSWTIVHMTHVIAKEKQNKMSLQNVSIVLSPTMQISHRVLNVLFTYSKILFRDVVIKKYVPPLRAVTSRWSLELPDSPASLQEELKKQESLLAKLHEELMTVKDVDKEEQVWEVQRVVTQLKRKLKLSKKQAEMSKKAKENQETDKSESTKTSQQKTTASQVEATASSQQQGPQLVPKPKLNQPFRRQILLPLVPQKVSLASAPAKLEDEEPKEEKAKEIVFRSVEELEEQLKEVELETKKEDKKNDRKEEASEEASAETPAAQEKEENEPDQAAEKDNAEAETKEDPQSVDHSTEDKQTTEQEEDDLSKQDLSEENTLEAKTEDEAEMSDEIQDISNAEEVMEEVPPELDKNEDKTDEERDVESLEEEEEIEEDDDEEEEEEEENIDKEEINRLLLQEAELLLEEEELLAIRHELYKKIETEQNEIERLHQEIADVRTIRDDIYTDSSCSESSDESGEEWELEEILTNLRQENGQLERENQELCDKVHQERQICLEVKVQIRMIQQGHLDNAAGLEEEKEGILVQL